MRSRAFLFAALSLVLLLAVFPSCSARAAADDDDDLKELDLDSLFNDWDSSENDLPPLGDDEESEENDDDDEDDDNIEGDVEEATETTATPALPTKVSNAITALDNRVKEINTAAVNDGCKRYSVYNTLIHGRFVLAIEDWKGIARATVAKAKQREGAKCPATAGTLSQSVNNRKTRFAQEFRKSFTKGRATFLQRLRAGKPFLDCRNGHNTRANDLREKLAVAYDTATTPVERDTSIDPLQVCDYEWKRFGLLHCNLEEFLQNACRFSIPCAFSIAQQWSNNFYANRIKSISDVGQDSPFVFEELMAFSCGEALIQTWSALANEAFFECNCPKDVPSTTATKVVAQSRTGAAASVGAVKLMQLMGFGSCFNIPSQCDICPSGDYCPNNARDLFGCM